MDKEITVNETLYRIVPLPGKISFRSYRDEDYETVCDFLIELNQKDRTHINWNWARFEWMMEHPEFDKCARSSIGLWWSAGKVVGAAINKENTAEIRAAWQAGFGQIDQKETVMELSLDRDFSSTLPEGLQLREIIKSLSLFFFRDTVILSDKSRLRNRL